jgi:hypothetical protein
MEEPMSKFSTHCKNGHELTPENVRAGDSQTGRVCKTCQMLRCREYVKNKPEMLRKRVEKNKAMMREKKAQLVAYKGGVCLDCGGVFPTCCYHFDHREPAQKTAGIAQLMHRPIEEVKLEADKCDLVCANCHAVRTFGNEQVGLKISLTKTGLWKS